MTMTATERSRITSLLGADADSLLSYTSKFVNKSTLHLPGLPIYLAGLCFLTAFMLAWGFAHPHRQEAAPEPTVA